MPDIVLLADSKRPIGTRPSRRLRHTGRIPAVVYGHGMPSTPISVDARSLRSALSTSAGLNAVFELEVDGTRHLAMAKVVDHHPVRHTIAHVDFIVIRRDEKVTADVPITLVGESEAVKAADGVIEQVLHTLSVSMLPNQIPDAIEADISSLDAGGSLRLADVRLPAGVSTDADPETIVVSATHGVAVEEVEAAPAEEAEGEAAPEEAAAPEGSAPEGA